MTATSGSPSRPAAWLDRFWRFASSGRLTLAFGALLALTLALAVLFPQAPGGAEPGELERWLTAAAARYRETGSLLRLLGVFTILQSFWLRLLSALLAYNLALRLADQLAALSRAWRPLDAPPPLRPGLAVAHVTVSAAAEPVLATVEELLRSRKGQLVTAAAPDGACVYSRRGRPGAARGVLATAGLLLLLGGLFVNLTAGWQTAALPLTVHSSTPLSPANNLRIALDAVEGEGAAATITVGLTWPDGRQERRRLGVYRPAHVGDLWIAALDARPTLAALAARAASGNRPLLLQSLAAEGQAGEELRTPFRQAQTEQAFAIPAHNLTFRVVSYDALPAQGVTGPVFLVEAYRGDDPTPILTQLIETEALLTLGDVTVNLQRDRYVVLAAAYLPGLALWGLAGIALLAAAVLGVAWRYAETWAHLAGRPPIVAVAFRTAAGRRGRAALQQLVEAVAAAYPAPDGESDASAPRGSSGGPAA